VKRPSARKPRSRAAALLAAGLMLAAALAARADELVVVEARGIGLHPGDVLNDAKTLTLKQGQHVTLIAVNGATVKLDGPYDRAPNAEGGANGDQYGTALRALVTQSVARAEAGVSRSGIARVVLPEPWLMNMSRSGIVCLRRGDRPVLWREQAGPESRLTIIAGDRTWRADATWQAGADRLAVSGDFPIAGGKTYHVRLDANEAAVTVKTVPGELTTGVMQAAWLADVGCEPQAEALFKTLR